MVTAKNKAFIPAIAIIVAAVLLVLAFFLPYATAKDDYREYLSQYPNEMYADEANMTNGDAVDISLFEFAQMYAAYISSAAGNSATIAIICVVMIAVIGLFTLMILLFSALRKAIPIIIFDILLFGTYSLLCWDFSDRGVLPSSNYDFGMANAVYYIGMSLAIAGAIWLLVAKIINKHKRSNEVDVVNA